MYIMYLINTALVAIDDDYFIHDYYHEKHQSANNVNPSSITLAYIHIIIVYKV